MAQDKQPQPRSLADRLRDLLETIERAMKPTPQAPQPIPVRQPPYRR